MELTAAGHALLDQARLVLADTAAFIDMARRAKDGLANTLRIAMAPGLCEVVNRIREYMVHQAPHVSIEGIDTSSSGQHAALRQRTADIGLLRHVPDDPDIMSEPLFCERFVVMISETSRLAQLRSVRLEQLTGERLLLQDRDWASLTEEKILSLYAAAGVRPDIATFEASPGNQASMLVVASGQSVLSRTARGRSVAVTCLSTASPSSHSTSRMRSSRVQLAWRKSEASRAVHEFLKAARQLFSQS